MSVRCLGLSYESVCSFCYLLALLKFMLISVCSSWSFDFIFVDFNVYVASLKPLFYDWGVSPGPVACCDWSGPILSFGEPHRNDCVSYWLAG